MKLRDLPRALGLDQAPREYPHVVDTFIRPRDGTVQLARWLHPGERPKAITQKSVDALRSFLHEGDVAIDIGAHTGDSTVPMALAVGPRGSVFALEPNPYVFKVLAVNAALNPSKTRIVPLMFAAMPQDGEFEFEYSDAGYCNGGLHEGISRWTHGHFSKLPRPTYVYSKLTESSARSSIQTIGNPNLNPETTVQYELGLRNQITEEVG